MLIGIWRRDWQKARHDDARCRRRYWKSGQDLTRYFPEVLTAALMLREKHFVMNGELVVPVGGRFSFDDLLQRIHPAASRVKKLAEQALALFLAFDLLKKGRTDLAAMSLRKRWPLLEDFAENDLPSVDLFRLSPASLKLKDAERWLASAGGGSDGVIAKRLDLPYQTGNRDGTQKIKKYRSADCVIGGFRYGENLQAGRAHANSHAETRNYNASSAATSGERQTGDPHRLESLGAIEKAPGQFCRQAATNDFPSTRGCSPS